MPTDTWTLTVIILCPLVGAVLLWLPPYGNGASVRRTALCFSLVTLLAVVYAAIRFFADAPTAPGGDSAYLLRFTRPWLVGFEERGIDIGYRVGVDGVSLFLLLLTALLTPLCIGSSFTAVRNREREYYSLILLLQTALLGVFCSLDLLLFYVFFEFTLIPLYFLIGIWGGPERKRAANKFFLFTLTGSVLAFVGILYAAYLTHRDLGRISLNLEILKDLGQNGFISGRAQFWLFLALAAGFAVKVPLFPVHTWLPLAHTEAPTAGSVILAGVLLKLGTYGFCRVSLPILPDASMKLAPYMAVLAIIGILYASLAAWVQRDVKKLVAYSSVAHLGFCMLGLFSMKVAGVNGAVLYMLNHGLSTGALFLVVGCLYERYHTRRLDELGGLARTMPWMAFFLIVFTLSSIGLPGLNGFVGEFLVLLGTATSGSIADLRPAGPLGFAYVIPAALGIILGAVYMLWMCQRLLFGPLREPPHTPDRSTGLTIDLTGREKAILAPLAILCLLLGVYPRAVLDPIEVSVRQHILPPSAYLSRNAPWDGTGIDRAEEGVTTSLARNDPPDRSSHPVAERVGQTKTKNSAPRSPEARGGLSKGSFHP